MSNIVRKDHSLAFTTEQRDMIRRMYLAGAPEPQAEVLLEIARLRGLNPLLKQIHFVLRGNIYTVQVSIDGLRVLAQRSGLYAGQGEPHFEYDERGKLKLCKVEVYRSDWARPCVGVAYFAEYAQNNQFWNTKPHVMLAKVAESIAIRKAFPEDASGIYSDDEMDEPPNVAASPIAFKSDELSAQVLKLEGRPASKERLRLIDLIECMTLADVASVTAFATSAGLVTDPELAARFNARVAALKAEEGQ